MSAETAIARSARQASRDWLTKKLDPAYARNKKLWDRYGISAADYDILLEDQGGVCAICGEPETVKFRGQVRRLAVDHDHETDRIRGLLCHTCNVALVSSHDLAWYLKAVEYLS